ncbi:unnamed protein product [Ectocarpus sp. 13 AM-2016]
MRKVCATTACGSLVLEQHEGMPQRSPVSSPFTRVSWTTGRHGHEVRPEWLLLAKRQQQQQQQRQRHSIRQEAQAVRLRNVPSFHQKIA